MACWFSRPIYLSMKRSQNPKFSTTVEEQKVQNEFSWRAHSSPLLSNMLSSVVKMTTRILAELFLCNCSSNFSGESTKNWIHWQGIYAHICLGVQVSISFHPTGHIAMPVFMPQESIIADKFYTMTLEFQRHRNVLSL